MKDDKNIIIYNTQDGLASVSLLTKDGTVWMNQNQMAELFDTSKQNISAHILTILEESELAENSVVKNYLTTAVLQEKGQVIGVSYFHILYTFQLLLFYPKFGYAKY